MEKSDKYNLIILAALLMGVIGFLIFKPPMVTTYPHQIDSEAIMIIYKRGYLEGVLSGMENPSKADWERFKNDSTEVKEQVNRLVNLLK